MPGCIAVGGSAAAVLARHRVSHDTDHLLADLTSRFDSVLGALEQHAEWRTAPVLILGSIGGVQVGFRQARHRGPIQTRIVDTPGGPLIVPTLDEMIGMKAYLAVARNTTRDYVDFAALASLAGDGASIEALLKSQDRYGHLQTGSISLAIADRLSHPAP